MIASGARRIACALAVGLALAGCAAPAPSLSGHSEVQLYGQVDEGVQVRP